MSYFGKNVINESYNPAVAIMRLLEIQNAICAVNNNIINRKECKKIIEKVKNESENESNK